MKYIFITFSLFCICTQSYSQKLDSLKLFYFNSSYFKAADYGKQIIQNTTDNPEIYYLTGMSNLKINKSDNAEILLKKAFNLDTAKIKYINAYARVLVENKDYKNAIKLYNKALQIDPVNFAALNNVSKIFMLQKKYKKAINTYLSLRKLDSLNSYYSEKIGLCYLKLNDRANSFQYYLNAYQTDSTNMRNLKNLALLCYKNELYKLSLSYCDKGIKADSSNSAFYKIKANTFYKKEQNISAIPFYKKAVELGDSSYNTLKRLGMILCDTKQYKNALEYNLAVYAKDTSSFSNTLYLCRNYLGLGEYDKSIYFAEKTLENTYFAKVVSFETYDLLAQNYTEKKDFHTALKMYDKKYGVMNKRYLEDYYNIALLYDKTGNKKKAIRFYKKVIEIKKEYLKPDEKDDIYKYAEHRITRLLEELHFEGN